MVGDGSRRSPLALAITGHVCKTTKSNLASHGGRHKCNFDRRLHVAAVLFTELVNFVLVYRLPEYKKNVADIEKENEALEGLKAKLDGASLTQKDKIKKSIRKSKAKVKEYNQKMFGIKFKSTLMSVLTTVAVFAVLSSAYEGEVI